MAKCRKNCRSYFTLRILNPLMYPSFTCCYMLGMFPYKINALIFEISTPRYILSTIVICICIIFLLYSLYIFYIFDSFGSGYQIPQILNYSCFYIFSGFIAIVTYILSGPRMRLLQTVKDISSKLPSELYQKLSKLIHAKDLLGSLFLLLEMHIHLVIYQHFKK